MGKRKTEQLSVQYLLRIQQLFSEKQWEIDSADENGFSLFNRFCQRTRDIGDNKQRDLFLELSERYLWIPQEEYLPQLIKTLKKMYVQMENITYETDIYIMPLIAPEDMGKVKSGTMLAYLFNEVKLRYDKVVGSYRYTLVSGIADVCKLLEKENSVLILVDDFIGTGETAEKCLKNLAFTSEQYHKVCVLALVAQECGVRKLEEYGVSVVAGTLLQRGITDYYEEDAVVKDKLALMEQIEQRMSVKKENRLGYKQSEALVSLCRTPNNTFPVFWEEKGNLKVAPFPR